MSYIRRNDPGYYIWQKRRQINIERHKKKRELRKFGLPRHNLISSTEHSQQAGNKRIILIVPCSFSLKYNQNEVCHFFSRVLRIVSQPKRDIEVFFDMSNIKVISVDAIIYLLALISNVKHTSVYRVSFRGNVPINAECNEALDQVGFFNYVYKQGEKVFQPKREGPYIIKTGREVTTSIAKELCSVVNEKTIYDRLQTKSLYSVIGELMTNSVQHAYEDNEADMVNQWFICVEESIDEIRFVFLDTGTGIPATVAKNWPEKVTGTLVGNDEVILQSAFLGDFRTRTKKENRGRGLPSIYHNCLNGIIEEAVILSGYGVCDISSKVENNIQCRKLPVKFAGTLFTWVIRKGEQSA